MTSLKITPNFEKKTAKFEGTIAGGERVRVEISDVNKYIGGLNSLRLRAVGSQGETLAQFPFENSKDAWVQEVGKIICELNLNTDKLLEAVPPASRAMILFVLDDGKNEVLYFKSFCAVDHWPRKVGEEEPVDLGGYADFVKDATESIASAEAAIEKASENAMNASENAKEAVATAKKIESSLSTKADKTALADEVARATQSEAQIDDKINTIVADDAGKSARTIAAEEVAKVVADAPADFDTLKEIAEYIESDKTGAAQMVTKIDANANAISAEAQRAQEAEAALREEVRGKVDVVEGKGLSTNDYTTEDKAKLAGIDLSKYALQMSVEMVATTAVSAQEAANTAQEAANTAQEAANTATTGLSELRTLYVDVSGKAEDARVLSEMADSTARHAMETANAAYSPTNPPPAPDLSGYATKDAALPRYQFTSAGILDGVVTIPPYVYAGMLSDGTAFTVVVGEGNGYMRDCILIVECGDVAPTITWPANFHPRTDAETDFACVAGVNNVHVNNVYWISEYAQGEFAVAGWQATAGGSAV